MFRSALGLDLRSACLVPRRAEQVREALLQLQVLVTGTCRRIGCAGDLAVLGLEQREQARFDREPRERSCPRAPSPSRAGTARRCGCSARRGSPSRASPWPRGRAGSRRSPSRRRECACAMAISGTFLPVPKTLPGGGADGRRGRGARRRRRRARALHAGVHVRLVVVADVEHVVVALEHSRTGSRSRCPWCRRRRPARSRARRRVPGAHAPPRRRRRRPRRCRTASGSTGSATSVSGYGVENTSRQPVALTAISWLSVARIAASIA